MAFKQRVKAKPRFLLLDGLLMTARPKLPGFKITSSLGAPVDGSGDPALSSVESAVDSLISSGREAGYFDLEAYDLDPRGALTDAQIQDHLDAWNQIVAHARAYAASLGRTGLRFGFYDGFFRDTGASTPLHTGVKYNQTQMDAYKAAISFHNYISTVSPFSNYIERSDYIFPSCYAFYNNRGLSEATEISRYRLWLQDRLEGYNYAFPNKKIVPFLWPWGHEGGTYVHRAWSYDFFGAMLDECWKHYLNNKCAGAIIWGGFDSSLSTNYHEYTPNTTLANWQAVTAGYFSTDLNWVDINHSSTDFSSIASMDDVASVFQTKINSNATYSSRGHQCLVTWNAGTGKMKFARDSAPPAYDYQDSKRCTAASYIGTPPAGTDVTVSSLLNIASQTANTTSGNSTEWTDQVENGGGAGVYAPWWQAVLDFRSAHGL